MSNNIWILLYDFNKEKEQLLIVAKEIGAFVVMDRLSKSVFAKKPYSHIIANEIISGLKEVGFHLDDAKASLPTVRQINLIFDNRENEYIREVFNFSSSYLAVDEVSGDLKIKNLKNGKLSDISRFNCKANALIVKS